MHCGSLRTTFVLSHLRRSRDRCRSNRTEALSGLRTCGGLECCVVAKRNLEDLARNALIGGNLYFHRLTENMPMGLDMMKGVSEHDRQRKYPGRSLDISLSLIEYFNGVCFLTTNSDLYEQAF